RNSTKSRQSRNTINERPRTLGGLTGRGKLRFQDVQGDTSMQRFARCRFLSASFSRTRALYCTFLVLGIFCVPTKLLLAADAPRHIPLSLKPDDVLPTGNEWIALPEIRATDGAIASFNVLSMRDRGLLEVTGARGNPVLQAYFTLNGK